MSYWRIRFRVDAAHTERLEERLSEFGAIATTLENAGDDAFYEVAYPRTPEWKEVAVTGLFLSGINTDLVVAGVLDIVGKDSVYDVSELQEENWERSWLSSFQPQKFGDRLWVCPSWTVPPDPGALNLILDPGLAFGTGTHPTTAGCLRWLDKHRPRGKRVVDYGCGSGILAIASLLLGADHAWGTDVDPRALGASESNARRNGVAERYSACLPQDLPDGLLVDLVLANILANVLIELRDRLLSLLNDRGIIVLTGILPQQSAEVVGAFGAGLSFEQLQIDEWSVLVGYRG